MNPKRIHIPAWNGSQLASLEDYQTYHPLRNPKVNLKQGDYIQLKEGVFYLDEDLNPHTLSSLSLR